MASSPSVRIRSVRREDLDDLRETYYEIYDDRDAGEFVGLTLFATRPTPADEVEWLDRALQRVEEGEEIFLVAEVDGHAVGSCTIARMAPTPSSEQAHVGELGILVRRAFRGKGVGSALLERAVAEARSNFEVLYLSVFSANEAAQRLYRKLGFTVCGHLPRMVKRAGRYYDEERMVLVFPPAPSRPEANP